MGDSMLSEHDAVDVAIDSERFLELLKNAEQLSLVSFLAQIPLPIAILDKESRFLGLNQLFADIYDSDALYLNGKLLKNISIIVYNQFMELLPGFQAGSKYANFEFYAKGHFYLSGLVVTDSPASIGTDRLRFSANRSYFSKRGGKAKISKPREFSLSNATIMAGKGWVSAIALS